MMEIEKKALTPFLLYVDASFVLLIDKHRACLFLMLSSRTHTLPSIRINVEERLTHLT